MIRRAFSFFDVTESVGVPSSRRHEAESSRRGYARVSRVFIVLGADRRRTPSSESEFVGVRRFSWVIFAVRRRRFPFSATKTLPPTENPRFPVRYPLTGRDDADRNRSLSRQARRPPGFRSRLADGTGRRDAAGIAIWKAEDHDRVRPGPLTFRAGRGGTPRTPVLFVRSARSNEIVNPDGASGRCRGAASCAGCPRKGNGRKAGSSEG
jgi:hypothetical protein